MAGRLAGDRVNPDDEPAGLSLEQQPAPALQLSAAREFSSQWRMRLEATLTAGALDVHNLDTDEKYRFGDLRTLAVLGLIEGKLVDQLDWQAGAGGIFYLPAERKGLFQNGGTQRWLLALGLTRRVSLGQHLSASLSVRYDYHEFTTPILVDLGWSQQQSIHRAGLTLGLERVF